MSERSPSTTNYMLGKGKLYLDLLDANGNRTGEIDIGNCPSFAITPSVETLDHYESMGGIKEKDKSVDTTAGFTAKFTTDEYSRWNLMLAILGTSEGTFSQGTGHQVNESAMVYINKWTKLERRNVHSLVVTNEGHTTTYEEGTDYEVDKTVGRIKALSGGSLSGGQTVHVDYNYDATQYSTLSAMEDSSLEVFVRFVGDPQVGPTYEIEIWRGKIKPAGDINMISEEWATMDFEIELLKDATNHASDPWFKIYDTSQNDSAVS
jgi:hypothetical protein